MMRLVVVACTARAMWSRIANLLLACATFGFLVYGCTETKEATPTDRAQAEALEDAHRAVGALAGLEAGKRGEMRDLLAKASLQTALVAIIELRESNRGASVSTSELREAEPALRFVDARTASSAPTMISVSQSKRDVQVASIGAAACFGIRTTIGRSDRVGGWMYASAKETPCSASSFSLEHYSAEPWS